MTNVSSMLVGLATALLLAGCAGEAGNNEGSSEELVGAEEAPAVTVETGVTPDGLASIPIGSAQVGKEVRDGITKPWESNW